MMVRSFWTRLGGTERGSAIVEMALVMPVLVLMIAGLVDFGRNIYSAASLENAARTGVQYAQLYPGDGPGLLATVQGAGGVANDATVTWEAYCVCPNGARTACDVTCSDTTKPMWLIAVSVSQPFRTLLPYSDFILPTAIGGNAVIRVR